MSALVSLDFLYLARLGLRAANDPHLENTVKVVDALLRVETPSGVGYRRYNEDGYGRASATAALSTASGSVAYGRC